MRNGTIFLLCENLPNLPPILLIVAGFCEEFGAVSGVGSPVHHPPLVPSAASAVGEQAGDGDAVGGVEGEGLVEGGEGTGDFFVWEQAGEGEAAVIVDGDVQGLDAGAWVAMGALAGGAHAWALEAARAS